MAMQNKYFLSGCFCSRNFSTFFFCCWLNKCSDVQIVVRWRWGDYIKKTRVKIFSILKNTIKRKVITTTKKFKLRFHFLWDFVSAARNRQQQQHLKCRIVCGCFETTSSSVKCSWTPTFVSMTIFNALRHSQSYVLQQHLNSNIGQYSYIVKNN